MWCIFYFLLVFTNFIHSEIVPVLTIVDTCSYISYDFDTNNLKPTPVNTDDVIYYLYTNSNRIKPVVIEEKNVNALENTTFNSGDNLLFVVHGWLGTYNTTLGQAVVPNAFSGGRKLNVFIVDWNALARDTFPVAREAVAGVGAHIAGFIGKIQKKYDVNDQQIHLVGHSFGAHIVGVAGKILEGRPRSIVALDPSQPLFTIDGNDTLKATDAQYVQVIHTYGGPGAIIDAIGDADFYPNDGSSQPGCPTTSGSDCNHMRAVLYYGESLLDTEIFLGTQCENYDYYLANKCADGKKARMGTLNPDTRAFGRYYLKTNSQSPFAEN